MAKFVTVGVAGHVDHGKTSLVKCLTGVDADRLREEKERGISIETGIVPCVLPSGTKIAVVDVPGHKNFFKNTIRGLTMTDIAILVIAADDGVMPQTKEHLEILRFAGCENGVVVLSKADLVDREILGFGRTGGIPVLEHLDTIGLTMRTGNVRVLKNRSPSSQESLSSPYSPAGQAF
jgi:selenocysteine-specific elongation factor